MINARQSPPLGNEGAWSEHQSLCLENRVDAYEINQELTHTDHLEIQRLNKNLEALDT